MMVLLVLGRALLIERIQYAWLNWLIIGSWAMNSETMVNFILLYSDNQVPKSGKIMWSFEMELDS